MERGLLVLVNLVVLDYQLLGLPIPLPSDSLLSMMPLRVHTRKMPQRQYRPSIVTCVESLLWHARYSLFRLLGTLLFLPIRTGWRPRTLVTASCAQSHGQRSPHPLAAWFLIMAKPPASKTGGKVPSQSKLLLCSLAVQRTKKKRYGRGLWLRLTHCWQRTAESTRQIKQGRRYQVRPWMLTRMMNRKNLRIPGPRLLMIKEP